jgi:hypothetical protein
MQVQQYAINIACPRCGIEKTVHVPNKLLSEKKFGHIKIQVPKGAVCQDHVFVVFLDVKGRIIGYESVDLSIQSMSETKLSEKIDIADDKTISLEKFIDSIGFNCFAGLIHSKLFNYPLYLIMNRDFKVNLDVINNVLDEMMPETYRNRRNLQVIDFNGTTYPAATYFYALVKNQKRTAFLMNPRKLIVQMPWKTGIELEKSIINSALKKEGHIDQVKFITFFINKFLEDVDKTIAILETTKKKSKKDLVRILKEKSPLSTITKNRVSSIKEFIHRRKSPEIAKKIQD